MSSLASWLRQPAQLLSPREKLWMYLCLGCYIFVFFLFFQPFGVNNYDPRETITLTFVLYMVIFSAYITAVLLLNEWLSFKLIAHHLVLRAQLILWMVWTLIFSATLIFLFYNWLGDWHDFSWSSWLEFIINFAVLGIIPVSLIFMYARLQQLKALTQTNKDYQSDAQQLITFPSDNQKDVLSLSLENILYLESEDNYVAVHYLQSGSFQKALVRLTLKRIQSLALHPALIRCHRSYMVNLFHVHQFNGNEQQGQIRLQHVDQPFPVSKTFAPAVISKLQ